MTDKRKRPTIRELLERRTVKDVDHTHPHTGEPFGSSGVYERGEERTADDDEDGERVSVSVDGEGATDRRANRGTRGTMKDVDHTPPDDVGAQRTFDRGEERPPGSDVPDRDDEADEV